VLAQLLQWPSGVTAPVAERLLSRSIPELFRLGFFNCFCRFRGTNSDLARDLLLGDIEANTVIGRQYLARQATTLLKFAKSTTDAKLAALLVEKAADLKSQVDERYPPVDQSPRAPDVEPLEQRGR
jgi:hypothetical protein